MEPLSIEPPATVHLIGVCGTGMGALAGMLTERGFRVRGSDSHPYPPMSTELARRGVRVIEGYRASNLDHEPDLVVVGNVCRPDHPEAVAAEQRGLRRASLPQVIHDLFLRDRIPIVVAGTHGKTTTTGLTAYLLHATGCDPSFFIGGLSTDFGAGFRLGDGAHFAIEGDEYDSAYFDKRPKFLSYAAQAAVITSVEHDHVDIYPTADDYRAAFVELARLVDPGPLAVFAGDRAALEVARGARARVVTYAVAGDPVIERPDWIATPADDLAFDLSVDGNRVARFRSAIGGKHNLRNTLAALIVSSRSAGVELAELGQALPGFKGVARRQQILSCAGGITIYDDFAHHPTAVRETLEALAAQHPPKRLLAAFEPRSATACRRLHQQPYATAFDAAGLAIIAPVGRDLPPDERLDTARLAADLNRRGVKAIAAASNDEVLAKIIEWAGPGDGVALLSNGDFGGIRQRLVAELG
jgi:UDP-N-acetylmuramate: L-alanyl-gamma-D-glutamyl-meso-diaminopimelate ligase